MEITDAILHCYTKESGFQSFFFERCLYLAKNKREAYLVPLNELLITTVDNAKSTELSPTQKKYESIENSFPDYDVKISSFNIFYFRFSCIKFLKMNIKIALYIEKLRNCIPNF